MNTNHDGGTPLTSGSAAGTPSGVLGQLTSRLKKGLRHHAGGRPERFCLITGSPRSGTTALHEWLSGNPRVEAATESRILIAAHAFVAQVRRFKRLDKYARAVLPRVREVVLDHYDRREMKGRDVVIDKEPLEPIALPARDYAAFLESVRALFPGCKLIFMVRDPYATTWSMTQRTWGHSLVGVEPRSFSLDEHATNWADCAELALRYADDPDAYVCSFERLVNEPEQESARVCAFLGVPMAEAFRPAPVKRVGFADDERARVEQITRAPAAELQRRGLWAPEPESAAAATGAVAGAAGAGAAGAR